MTPPAHPGDPDPGCAQLINLCGTLVGFPHGTCAEEEQNANAKDPEEQKFHSSIWKLFDVNGRFVWMRFKLEWRARTCRSVLSRLEFHDFGLHQFNLPAGKVAIFFVGVNVVVDVVVHVRARGRERLFGLRPEGNAAD